MKTLIRITTVPISLDKLIEGQLKYMSSHFKVIAVSSNKEELQKVGKKEGVETFHIEMTRKITPFKDLKAIWKLYKFFLRTQPDIVHSHTPKAGLVSMLAAYFAKVPKRMHTVAGLPLTEAKGIKKQILLFVEKIIYRCATKVYPNSFGLQRIILNNKLTKTNKLKVIAKGSSNGINLNYFNRNKISVDYQNSIKESIGIKVSDFVYIFVGRLVGDKGINELVLSFNKLNLLHPNSIKLLLVGSFEKELDPLNGNVLDIINKNKNIICTGYKTDVRPYFLISDILTFPSYREGFPNVVLQAGAMNLPSIVSNINGCNEIIQEGINGYIVESKNETELFQAMQKAFNNREEIKIFGKNARIKLEDKFDQKMIWQEILNEYKQL